MMEASSDTASLVEITSEIVAAYVSRSSVPVAELPRLMRSVHETLTGLGAAPGTEAAPEPLKPAVPVRKSITDEFIISLEDGCKLKSMKRYLAGLGMTAAEYRNRWGLPPAYPMVAPSYARQRSELARTLGLGRKPAGTASEAALAPQPEPELPLQPEAAAPAPKRGGRRKAG